MLSVNLNAQIAMFLDLSQEDGVVETVNTDSIRSAAAELFQEMIEIAGDLDNLYASGWTSVLEDDNETLTLWNDDVEDVEETIDLCNLGIDLVDGPWTLDEDWFVDEEDEEVDINAPIPYYIMRR